MKQESAKKKENSDKGILLDPDRKSHAVILKDGTLDENPGFVIRG